MKRTDAIAADSSIIKNNNNPETHLRTQNNLYTRGRGVALNASHKVWCACVLVSISGQTIYSLLCCIGFFAAQYTSHVDKQSPPQPPPPWECVSCIKNPFRFKYALFTYSCTIIVGAMDRSDKFCERISMYLLHHYTALQKEFARNT